MGLAFPISYWVLATLLAASVLIDGLVRPRALRSLRGLWLHVLVVTAFAGLVLTICGSILIAGFASVAVVATLSLVSNAKRAVLGEPLLFTDLVLIGAVFRHPQFYLSALKRWQLAALWLGAAIMVLIVAWQFEADPMPHLAGLALLVGSVGLLAFTLTLPPWRRMAQVPDATGDVASHGLLATLLLYWWRWLRIPDPAPSSAALPAEAQAELVVIVQCESFADPVELFADPTLSLAGLTNARQFAWAQGRLLVSGFGAYTMRTEYGLVFGREEEQLGFRRYDPYLTALGEASHALPARLGRAGWRSLFLHPHDMRFYSRHRILPAAGFAELVGPEAFAPPQDGRYVTDDAVTDVIIARARDASGPTLIHAVTIENHGPWPVDQTGQHGLQSGAYLRLVAKGDAMLHRLVTELPTLGRPSVLVFYGDHRPSIPGAVIPGGDRHTPFLVLRFAADGTPIIRPDAVQDMTPAELHRAVIEAITA